MDRYKTARLESNQLVVSEALSHPTTIKLIPAFELGIYRLHDINLMIENFSKETSKETSGITTETGNAKSEVISWTIDIVGAIHSYAKKKNDVKLMASTDVKSSAIEHLKKEKLLTKARTVLDLAKKISEDELSHEGISANEIKSFESAITYYNEIKYAPRVAELDKSSQNGQLDALFAEANDLLKNTLDRLATQFRRKDPVFYMKYKTARILPISSSKKKKDETKAK